MRPQHITAENGNQPAAGAGAAGASMRPQHITAENAARRRARRLRVLPLQ